MKVCFPVQKNEGTASAVYNHFGSAPLFLVVDTATNSALTISNQDRVHAQGACNPIKALGEQRVDAVVAGGIGGGALSRLNQSGIRVYRAVAGTIQDNLTRLTAEQLPEYTLQSCCDGHSHKHGCAH